ncbi:MAG: hypothetical protein WBL21_03745 [Salinimicrobium sp.]
MNKIRMELEITLQQGGMREFERTGIYPEYLIFHRPGTRSTWRIKIRNKPQMGVLKSKGKVVYEYSFDGNFCKFRKVKADGSFSAWKTPESMSFEMRD